VAGSSGQTSGGALNHPVMCISTNVLGSMLIEIHSNRLDAVFLRETGVTNDQFTILKENYAPLANNLNFNINADTSAQFALSGSDINRDPIQFAGSTLPTQGLLVGPDPTNGTFVYTPARGFAGMDSFAFIVSDGATNSTPGLVTLSVTPASDTNHNGISDNWEAQYSIASPDADDDEDGMTNLQEYWANTNPHDQQSWLRISSIASDPDAGFTLEWPSIGAVRYRVLLSDGDSSGSFSGVFIPLIRSVSAEMDPSPVGTMSTMRFKDDFSLTGVPAHGARYYRIQVVR